MSTRYYGNTKVEIHDGWVVTTLPDGTQVSALPMCRAEDYARANSIGYGDDLWAMTREHDPMHSQLCFWLGLPESPALRAASLGYDSELVGAEESAVLAIQRFVNECRKQGLLP